MQVLAWLPFVMALLVAFVAGFVFARISHGVRAAPAGGGEQAPHGRLNWYDLATLGPLLLLLALMLVWIVAAVFFLRSFI